MKKRSKFNKKVNKKGFTLVELLVSIAILAVIAIICAQFVSHSTNAYRKASSATKIQETCQDSLNQIANVVRNSKSLKVTKSIDGRITMESVNYENNNVLVVYVPNENEEENFGKIFVCYEYNVESGADITLLDSNGFNDYLLTDGVKDFTVELAKYQAKDDEGEEYTVEQQRVLDLKLTLERNNQEYTQYFKASLRNSSPEGQTTELIIDFKDQTNSD